MAEGNHLPGRVRTCDTYGLPICLNAQFFIRANAVLAVVFLLVGAIAGLLMALTRWTTVHALNAEWYYRVLTLHGLNMLIFWILFMEIAILYFVGTTLLKTRLASPAAAWVAFLLMVAGALMVDVTILMGKGDVLMTSYPPLQAHPAFYLGIILVAVGVLIGAINFLACVYIARRDKTYEGSMPLVAFGGLTAAIIAVCTILHGAAIMIPTFLWSVTYTWPDFLPAALQIQDMDPGVYRLVWWGLGHPSQQVNVAAMVAVWYLLATLTTGARPLNQGVCRVAFLLYILFINLASAHHLLVDPGLSAEWKMWNTSYAMYLAVLASMVHGLTVPASIEVAQRRKGFVKGLFGWVSALPWKDPAFAAVAVSLLIFGFGGGITGVTLGTVQINIQAHGTLRIPGHFHMTVAGGTTLAFMGLAYYVVPLIFQREYPARGLARIQPYIFGAGIFLMAIGMTWAGSFGVPRRHWDAKFTDAVFAPDLSAADPFLAMLGIGGVLAFIGAMIFILLTVYAVFLGRSNAGRAMESWQSPAADEATGALLVGEYRHDAKAHPISGTMVLVLVFLACFAVYYFANWKALADVWPVR